ncbi:MAG: acyl-CoA synthetase [Rhodospirillales bacterium]|jgi:fatty-acyl-CoA synthase|tara:strand:+ start:3913 stop:5592 length:1680 start_codon:yes stop_codon:yes gene_type:complete
MPIWHKAKHISLGRIATVAGNIYTQDLDKTQANFQPQTPLSYLDWAASVYPNKTAVIHGDKTYTYTEFRDRCVRLASALHRRGVGLGDTVSFMSPNGPAMLEAHYGVPMVGAVLNALNFRLDASTISMILKHAETKVLITDREFSSVISAALEKVDHKIIVIDIDDPQANGGDLIGEMDYEALIGGGDPEFSWSMPTDEWQAIALNYTSGTTGNPKGVVYHHRGAFLNAMGDVVMGGLNRNTIYLWTLPMFHCNGWCFTWAVTSVAGTHVCQRNVVPAEIFVKIKKYNVNFMCGAPIVLNMMVHASADDKAQFDQQVEVITGGAAPPSTIISSMEKMGFNVTHMYGLTECYGPSTVCAWQDEWSDLPLDQKSALMARQGVRYPTLFAQAVMNPDTMTSVPADGKTMGEIMLQGNTVMKGYLKNPEATAEAFKGGWYHTGDIAVLHPDGYVEVKDRSKDVIISGGENISSLEVEETLYKHSEIMEAAVVARPDDKWGELACAFVTLKPFAAPVTDKDIMNYCRDQLAHFKVPKTIVFGPLPKTSTGKIQKFILRDRAKEL